MSLNSFDYIKEIIQSLNDAGMEFSKGQYKDELEYLQEAKRCLNQLMLKQWQNRRRKRIWKRFIGRT